LPKQVKVNPISAEVIGADYLFKILLKMPSGSDKWRKRLQDYAEQQLLILRPILIDVKQYADHLAGISDWDGKRMRENIIKALRRIPANWMWMIELSVPELFSANRRKVGEVLLDAEVPAGPARDFSNFFLARLPGCFAFYLGGGSANPRYQFIRSHITGHAELYACEETHV
jgi:hypothetical protein